VEKLLGRQIARAGILESGGHRSTALRSWSWADSTSPRAASELN
jgi:hypothetical protein